MIVADKWLRADYGRKLRGYLTQAAQPVSLVDFGHSPIFPDADTFPCVAIFRRKPRDEAESNERVLVCRFPREDYDPHRPIGPYIVARAERVPLNRLNANGWSLENPAIQELLGKLCNSGDELRTVAGPPMYGVKTGLNEAFYIDDAARSRLIGGGSSFRRDHQTASAGPRYFSLAPNFLRHVGNPLPTRNCDRPLSGNQAASTTIPASPRTKTITVDGGARRMAGAGSGRLQLVRAAGEPVR